jgi:hypothetical protein
MGTWNFRVAKKDESFAVYYAYYNKDGELQGLSDLPASPVCEDVGDLQETLKAMLDGCDENVVDFATLKPLNEAS